MITEPFTAGNSLIHRVDPRLKIVFAVMLSMETRADESLFWVAVQVIIFAYMIWYCLTALKVAYQESWGISALKQAGLIALFLPTLSGALQLASLF